MIQTTVPEIEMFWSQELKVGHPIDNITLEKCVSYSKLIIGIDHWDFRIDPLMS